MIKLAIVHNEAKPFRNELFEHIQDKFDVKYFFLRYNTAGCKGIRNYDVLRYVRIPKMQDLEVPIGLYRKLKEYDPDIIVSTDLGYVITYISFFYSRANSKKFVLWNEQWRTLTHPRRYLTSPLENNIIRKSSAILAFGEKQRDYVVKRGANTEAVYVVPNAIPDSYVPRGCASYYEFKPSEFTILCLGRLVQFKGQRFLVEAFARLRKCVPNARLVIAGEGPCYTSLRKLVTALDLESHVFLPNQKFTEADKFHLLSNADLVVLPSTVTRTSEAWGLVVNEAASMGRPLVVTSAAGVSGEIVRHEYSGLVYKDKDVNELASAMLSIASEPKLAEEYGARAKRLVEREYSMGELKARFCDVITKVAEV